MLITYQTFLNLEPKKLKNKKVRNAMNSEIADMLVQEAQNRAKNKYDSLFG